MTNWAMFCLAILNFIWSTQGFLCHKSKTDVTVTGTCYCPVSVSWKYMAAGIGVDSNLSLFIIEVVLCILLGMESFPVEILKKLGFNPGDYGLHNLRSSGITSVVHNSSNSVPERLLRRHGRWKTNAALKDMYVKESLKKRLEVPVMRHLGL